MAVIRPFRALRYSPSAGALKDLVAPPYDVLSQEQRDGYAAKNAHNIVGLTLPEQLADDRSKFVKYARSAARLEEWRQSQALKLESQPSLYRYTQSFSTPCGPEQLVRQALIALIRLEPYEKGVVLPHEQTFPKHKEDRLRLLEATYAQLESIYGLYEDEGALVNQMVNNSPSAGSVEVCTEDSVHHKVDLIQDPRALDAIVSGLASKKVWIADGHHRYETALGFRAALGERSGEVPEDYMLMALSSIADPGLVLLPTHRMLKKLAISSEGLREKLGAHFSIIESDNVKLLPGIEALRVQGRRAFGVALPGDKGLILLVDDLEKLVNQMDSTGSTRLKSLDVSILHDFIFAKLLNLTGHEFFDYTRDPVEAIHAVDQGSPASFLMNPPTVEDMRQIALGGEKMPQKSTYYYPKILSGLVLWSLKDFENPL